MPNLLKPSKGEVTPKGGFTATHRGLDFGWGNGKIVTAAASGTLSYSRVFGYGLRARVNHSDGTFTTYSHLANVLHSKGHVDAGEPIATMGSSGAYAVGVHLHFEYWVKGVRVKPSFTTSAGTPGKPITDKNEALDRRKKITWLG